jgi:hypothetical protein
MFIVLINESSFAPPLPSNFFLINNYFCLGATGTEDPGSNPAKVLGFLGKQSNAVVHN